MNKVFVLGAIAALSACMDVPTSSEFGEFVSFSQALQENQGRPIECVDYDAGTNSCAVIATYRAVSGGIYSEGHFLVSADPRIEMSVGGVFVERDGALCSDGTSFDVEMDGVPNDFSRELATAQIESEISSIGETCTSFYRRGDGYISVTRDSSGGVVNEGDFGVSTFIAGRPRLRYAAPL